MSVTYRTSLKTTRMNDVVTDIGATGHLKIGTAAMGTVLADITLANPAGTVSSGVLTFSSTPLTDSSADNSGTAAAAIVTDGTNTIISGLTVSTSAADINLSSTTIVAGQPVTITSATITHG